MSQQVYCRPNKTSQKDATTQTTTSPPARRTAATQTIKPGQDPIDFEQIREAYPGHSGTNRSTSLTLFLPVPKRSTNPMTGGTSTKTIDHKTRTVCTVHIFETLSFRFLLIIVYFVVVACIRFMFGFPY